MTIAALQHRRHLVTRIVPICFVSSQAEQGRKQGLGPVLPLSRISQLIGPPLPLEECEGLAELLYLLLGLLDGGRAVPLSRPPLDVAAHLLQAALLGGNLDTQPAVPFSRRGGPYELQSAGLAHARLRRAPLAQVTPPPAATVPYRLVKEAHDSQRWPGLAGCHRNGREGGGRSRTWRGNQYK
jgi:hypothetical protein